ncbi:MAG: CvpA family protein [Erysipelotrichaceae bacterium]|nr:CvpA family protein [Erysipelotrichaceae bacterium]
MIKIPENLFPIINIIAIVLVVFTLYSGYKKGALWQVLRILGIGLVIVLAWIVSPGFAGLIKIYPKKWMPFGESFLADTFYDKFNQIAWFVVILIVGLIVLFFLMKPLLDMITDLPILKGLNGTIGAILSLIPVYIILVLVSYLLSTAIFFNGKDAVDRTVLKYIKSSSSAITSLIANSFDDNIALQKLFSDPLSLDQEDLKNIVEWLEKAKVSSEDIQKFFENYGIDVDRINEFFNPTN